MQIETDEWITAGEAARLLGVTHTRVIQMADEEGTLDVLRPWPRVVVIGRQSIEEWEAGGRQTRIKATMVRRWLLDTTKAATVQEVDINVVRDLLRDYIEANRPRWDAKRKDLWALDMASVLWSSGAHVA